MAAASPNARPKFVHSAAQRVAAVYAKALLGASEGAGQTEALLAQFDSLVRDVLDVFPKWEEVLASGLVPAEDKRAMLDRALARRASTLFLNFLKVLADHERLDHLRAIHVACHELHNQLRGRVAVEVRTATPLADGLAGKIEQGLRAMLAREPELVRVTDPELIGGLVLRVGDTVYDGSVSSQLRALRAQMIDRSIHEIQSRRDRFRHPDGD